MATPSAPSRTAATNARPFSVRVVADAAFSFYVNDDSTNADVYCSAVGNDNNLGSTSNSPKRTLQALLNAYQAVRPLTAAERELLPAMARAGALRFWISRLWDFYLPREAAMLTPHDPTHFERVLRERVQHPVTLTQA